MKIALFGQLNHKGAEKALDLLVTCLEKHDVELVFETSFYSDFKAKFEDKSIFKLYNSYDKLDSSYDLLISIGGDGTILRAITFVKDSNIPIVGINTGRLGFLATIQNEDIPTAVESIIKKQFKISERSLLSISTEPHNEAFNDLDFALNEIAVSRKNTTSMITVETQLNDEYLTSYWSDGLIISTPTGSTGYSLSCGGPVITPDTNSFVITPIAPHNLSARPLVITDSTEIKLKVSGREDNFLVSLDSRIATLSNETIITIKKASFTIKMVEFFNESFLDTLRKKLLWGEDKRN